MNYYSLSVIFKFILNCQSGFEWAYVFVDQMTLLLDGKNSRW